jgi:hypothetical protein
MVSISGLDDKSSSICNRARYEDAVNLAHLRAIPLIVCDHFDNRSDNRSGNELGRCSCICSCLLEVSAYDEETQYLVDLVYVGGFWLWYAKSLF